MLIQIGWKTTHFWGPVANWTIALAGITDLTTKGPEYISLQMTGTLCVYSAMFMRFAWMIRPRNYILFSCHIFNEGVQLTQLYRRLKYDREQKQQELQETTTSHDDKSSTNKNVMMCAATAAGFGIVPRLQRRITALPMPLKCRAFLQHPAGPFTIFFWAPTCKWGLSAANLLDYKRPVESVSVPQQLSLLATGAIWCRWSFVISPVNINLALVNMALASSALYMLARKYVYDPFPTTREHQQHQQQRDD
ncbi:Mitochondrial pyruvate carrier 2, variant 2 [Perkinsus olseni]|uniref:Mitochondrial pyruvate carrier n=1 Tax=Perkinsus olseni TaxID=32597 RepID=A0A7J6PNX4_PEROL|nr:Mitochondrial pyruvate carrier 2, variant 2 [Perkinsus olseni]